MSIEEGSENIPNEGIESEPAVDPMVNLKAEMNRKLENVNAAMAEQNRRLEEILNSVLKPTTEQPAAPAGKPLKDLVFDDPDAFVQQVVTQATSVADRKVAERLQASQAMQSVVMDIQTKYPEFAQAGSDATKLAVQKATSLPKHLQGTPEGAKLAMMEAVAELGLAPASKRQQQQQPSGDDFTIPGRSPGAASRQRQQDSKKDISQETLAFAELLGIDVNDPKRIEGLKSASQRKNWNKYA